MAKRNNLFIFILTIGVFGIINTEMGVIGILPLIADNFHVSVSKAGLLVKQKNPEKNKNRTLKKTGLFQALISH